MDAMKLRSVTDLTTAHEWLFNKQQAGEIDAKTADALNTTLKGATYLNGKLKLDAAKLYLQARIKKIDFPAGMMPELPA
jgi:hypothetical protein